LASLRHWKEWSPPYDLNDRTKPKADPIRAAIVAASIDLGFDEIDSTPISLIAGGAPYNIDALWSRIVARLPEVSCVQLLRRIRDLKFSNRLSRLWVQTANAGSVLAQTLRN